MRGGWGTGAAQLNQFRLCIVRKAPPKQFRVKRSVGHSRILAEAYKKRTAKMP